MALKFNIEKFIFIMKSNSLWGVFLSNTTTNSVPACIALHTYLKLLDLFNSDLISESDFTKIPNIKLIRDCSRQDIYDENDHIIDNDVMSLKLAKELLEALVSLGFINEKETHNPENTCHTHLSCCSYHISDTGVLLYKEIDECFSGVDSEVIILKILLLLPSCKLFSKGIYQSEFAKVYLDFLYYGGKHV